MQLSIDIGAEVRYQDRLLRDMVCSGSIISVLVRNGSRFKWLLFLYFFAG